MEISLYFLNDRYYDPLTGKFVSRDRSGVAAGVNLYHYAFNDPVNHTDASGMEQFAYGESGKKEVVDLPHQERIQAILRLQGGKMGRRERLRHGQPTVRDLGLAHPSTWLS